MEDYHFDRLKEKIFKERGFDLNLYSDKYVKRRINTRILGNELSQNAYEDYMKALDCKPEEYTKLFDALSVNVTEFFRDRTVWEKFYNKFLPPLIEEKLSQRMPTLRIWSAGCSTGEEPYSIAIMVREFLEKKDIKIPSNKFLVTIIATDIDKDALDRAQKGIYIGESLKNVNKINPGWLKKYFRGEDGETDFWTIGLEKKYQISDKIKKMVMFKQHNFISDKCYESIDMIFCRNVIVYFSPEIKDKLIQRLYNSLVYHGFIILGKSELIFAWAGKCYFYPVDNKEHIYRKERRAQEKQALKPVFPDRRKNWWGREIERIGEK